MILFQPLLSWSLLEQLNRNPNAQCMRRKTRSVWRTGMELERGNRLQKTLKRPESWARGVYTWYSKQWEAWAGKWLNRKHYLRKTSIMCRTELRGGKLRMWQPIRHLEVYHSKYRLRTQAGRIQLTVEAMTRKGIHKNCWVNVVTVWKNQWLLQDFWSRKTEEWKQSWQKWKGRKPVLIWSTEHQGEKVSFHGLQTSFSNLATKLHLRARLDGSVG